jgi:hypothetical protein
MKTFFPIGGGRPRPSAPVQRSIFTLLLSLAATRAEACATCGCSLSADAAKGYSATPGWRIDLEFDFINQNQLRSGHAPVSAAQLAALNDAGGDQEIEQGTINRYWTVGITYIPDPAWTVTLLLPYVNRTHSTYGSATSDQFNPDNLSGAHSVGFGDVKLIGAYQGFLVTHNLGLQFGVKLPTGRYGGQNVETGAQVGRAPVYFSTGPAAGSTLDTSLDPGTGSYDAIVGAYYYQPVSQNLDAFVNLQFQFAVAHALDQPNADFRPGNQENLSFGLRYERSPRWVPQLQINATHKSPDQGALADNTDTVGTVVYLSPGVTVAMSQHVQAFAFFQKPVFSDLEGYQVFPRWTGSLGLSYGF